MDGNNNHFNSPEGVSLKEYINDRLSNLEKSIDMRFNSVNLTTSSALTAVDKATTKAESAAEKRFDAVNEFRATLADQQRSLMPRAEVEILIKAVHEKIDNLNMITITRQSETRGHGLGEQMGLAWAIGIATVVSAIIIGISRILK